VLQEYLGVFRFLLVSYQIFLEELFFQRGNLHQSLAVGDLAEEMMTKMKMKMRRKKKKMEVKRKIMIKKRMKKTMMMVMRINLMKKINLAMIFEK